MNNSHNVNHGNFDGSSVGTVDAELNSELELSRRARLIARPRRTMPPLGGEDDLTLDEVKNVIRTYRRILISCTAAMLALAIFYCIIAKRRFESTGFLEIANTEISGLDALGNPGGAPSNPVASDAVEFGLIQPTQVKILESDTLALQVIRELDLEKTEDYAGKKPEPGEKPSKPLFAFQDKPLEPLSVPIDQAPNRRAKTLKIFHKRMTVKPLSGTRMISVSYVSPDPELAAAVVNHLMTDYSDFEFTARLANTNRAEKLIGQQLQDLKAKTEGLENNAIRLQRETGLYGEDASHNIVTSRLEALNTEATAAETNRIFKQAIYDQVRNGDAELITGLNGNSLNGTASVNSNSMQLLQTLRAQEEVLRPQIADYQSRYLPNHPKLVQLQAQLADVQKAIAQETARVRDRAKSDYLIALQTEQDAKRKLAEQKETANQLNDKNTAYLFARQEAEGSRALYSGLLQKLRQTDLFQGLKANNVIIVDEGRVPSKYDPAKPRIPLILAVGAGVGLLGGIIISLWFYQRGLKYQAISELARDGSLDVVGYLPEPEPASFNPIRKVMRFFGIPTKPVVGSSAEALAREPLYVDGILALRTSILYGGGARTPQVILTANTTPNMAKSYVGRNLASAFSSAGAHTLYVDADLQRGSFDTNAGSVAQLSKVLSTDTDDMRGFTTSPKHAPVNGRPSASWSGPDWLGSERMRAFVHQWRSEYDYIVINVDTALPATEATILATFADVTLLVVHPGITTARTFKALRKRLTEAVPPGGRLGVVFDGVPEQAPEYAAFFGQPATVGGAR